MVRKNLLKNITTSGGLLTADFIQSFQEQDYKHDKITPQSFSMPKKPIETKEELNRTVTEAWEKLKAIWDENSIRLEKLSREEARRVLITPILRELGFRLVSVSQNIEFEEGSIRLYLSHRGWWEDSAPKIHTVSPQQGLDERSSEDRNDRTPHDAMQLYLNLDKEQKWGIVTNGVLFRILREFHHTYTRGYVEFDLMNIFFERNFSDFLSLFRLTHASRFVEKDGIIPLEQFYEESVAAGVRIGEDLRENVKKAIELLGNGLLTNELRTSLADNSDITKKYYRELLKIIYRILFLMFAEQRGMLPMHESLYAEEYSLARLREKAQKRILLDTNYDFWYGLLKTFILIREGNDDLKVFGYNGDLFDDEQLQMILGLKCRNDILLRIIRFLTLYEKRKILQRINFLDIGVEEIGSIYESLLDFIPRILKNAEEIDGKDYQAGNFLLDPRGAARKTTGSYYTDKRLINELINSSLKPVTEKTLKNAGNTKEEKERAILELKVCDPACGSGAFLIAANNYLGKLLAQVRIGNKFPSEKEERIARRDVLQHCIYGVDLNPMAIELAKVSLWINAVVRNFPLNFLDHHLKPGNSLIGGNPVLIRKGILNSAFKSIKGDKLTLVRKLKKVNIQQRKSKTLDEFTEFDGRISFKEFTNLVDLSETTKEDVINKKTKYFNIIKQENYILQKLVYNFWTSIYFWTFLEELKDAPTQAKFRMISKGQINKVDESILSEVKKIAIKFKFFHWNLEFPEVFYSKKRGFDCILGNPPWETVELREKEFFLSSAPEIAILSSKNRKKAIRSLQESQPELYRTWINEVEGIERLKKFIKFSGKYKLTSSGRLNTYVLFTDAMESLLGNGGRAGIIIKTGLAVNNTTKDYFQYLYENNKLISLFDFENRKGLFPDVHRSERFSLLTLENTKTNKNMKFSFFLTDLEQLKSEISLYTLLKDDFNLINPNTKNCPTFRTKRDFKIVKHIYNQGHIFVVDIEEPHYNPWKVTFRQGLFNLSSETDKLKRIADLQKMDLRLNKLRVFEKNGKIEFLPVYEGRMIWLFDHRAGSVGTTDGTVFREGKTEVTQTVEYEDPGFHLIPRFWSSVKDIENVIPKSYKKEWLITYRRVTSATNERTLIATIIPRWGAGHTAPLIFTEYEAVDVCCLVANLNSIIMDYVARQKAGGTQMDLFILKQLPVISPDKFSLNIKEKIADLVFKLVYSSECMTVFARDLKRSEIIKWDELNRLKWIAEINAIFSHLYKLEEEDLEYILETFPIVKRKEKTKYGEYLTKKLTLKYYSKYKAELGR